MVQNCKIQNSYKPTLVPIFQNSSGSILKLRMHVEDLPTPYNVWDKLSSRYMESHSVVIAEFYSRYFTQNLRQINSFHYYIIIPFFTVNFSFFHTVSLIRSINIAFQSGDKNIHLVSLRNRS